MGGKPSRATKADMRLKANNPNAGKSASKGASKPMTSQPSTKKGGS